MTQTKFDTMEYLEIFKKASSAQKEESDRVKMANDQYFNFINQLIAQNLAFDLLKAELAKFAAKEGFDNVQDALNKITNSYGVSPLQNAFKEQKFSAARQLMNLGATFGAHERAEFDIASDSKSVREGLGRPAAVGKAEFHNVKRFGLTLGIEMTAQDGTSSQIAHIEPTYKMMADSVSSYSRSNPYNDDFKQIADAFNFSNKAGQFSRSTTSNPRAGAEIADRISDGKITTIPVGCKGHFMGMSIVPDGPGSKSGYMVFTNRGLGCNDNDCGTQIYRIDDMSKVDAKFINSMMNGLSNGTSHAEIMRQVHQVTGNKPPIEHIPQNGQKYDNCSIANPRANIHGILLCQKALAKGGFENLTSQDRQDVKANYKEFTSSMREEKVIELAAAIEKNPKDPDLVNIGKEYLSQHRHDTKLDKDIRARLQGAVDKASHDKGSDFSFDEPRMSAPR